MTRAEELVVEVLDGAGYGGMWKRTLITSVGERLSIGDELQAKQVVGEAIDSLLGIGMIIQHEGEMFFRPKFA